VGKRARLFVLALAAAAAVWAFVVYYRRCNPPAETPVERVVEPPVPAPPTLVGEGVLPSPDATWRKAQTSVGGVVLLAPQTFGGVLAAWARVPALATLVDGASPAFGAMGEGGRWVVAAHVVTASRARTTLLGDAGSGVTSDSRIGNLDVLKAESSWLGLAGDYVLVGSDRDALATLGPYAYRTLPTRPLPQSAAWASVDRGALAGVVKSELDARREALKKFLLDKDDEQRAAHGGRPPDLADPKPIVGALDALATEYEDRVVAMQRAELALDVDDDGFHARLTLTPPSEGEAKKWVDHLEGGSTAPLATSSTDALATLFWRSELPERERAAKGVTETLTSALGSRVPAADQAAFGEALARIAKARAGWTIVSVTSGAAPGALVRMAANDPAAITSSIESAIDLTRKPTWSKWESDALGVKKIERTPGRGLATFALEQGAFQASWTTRGGEVDLATGIDAASVLASATGQITLGSDAKVSGWLRGLHGEVVWALVARPLLVASSPRSDAALVALVHAGRDVALDARASGVLVRQLVVSSSKGF
jgi:hypothetical protein